jgi:hypothetical protein
MELLSLLACNKEHLQIADEKLNCCLKYGNMKGTLYWCEKDMSASAANVLMNITPTSTTKAMSCSMHAHTIQLFEDVS